MKPEAPRVAVVGAGYWGANLVRVAAELDVLGGVCDTDPLNRTRVNISFPDVPVFATYTDLLASSSIDAVILAVPAPIHAGYALRAIAAGKDVFVEKPLALTAADAQMVVDAAARAGRKLFVGHVLLYHPGVVQLLAELRSGAIGDVLHLRSRRLSWGKLREHENVWWSFAPHDVALMLAIFDGERPDAISSLQVVNVDRAIADFAYADFAFGRGRTAHIEVGWRDVDKSARLDVFGTSGVLTFEDSREGASLRVVPGGVRREAGHSALWLEPERLIPLAAGEPLACELAAFLAWLGGGDEPPTHGREGLEVVRLLEATQNNADAFLARQDVLV
jgi:UDP-2-acetamido-3-amino-2,3-dideoxy-glucuronate N-acetyltransferase